MGHLIAAAGAVEAAVCALAVQHGTLPVNANLRELDPDCDVDIVRDAPRARRVRVALSNSLGFGGSNSCLAFRHPDETGAAARRTAAESMAGAHASSSPAAGAICGSGRSPTRSGARSHGR